MSDQTERHGVLFDVDGTLIDSNYLHTLAWWQAFRQLGHDVPMAAIHRCIGMGGDKLLVHLLGEDRNTGEDAELSAGHDAIFSTHWPSLRAFEGAAELVHQCADAGLTVVLASSASGRELKVLREVLGADSAICAATSSSDAEHSKPSPDILQAALDAGGLSAERTVLVGDSVWDVMAARELGISTVGVSSGGTSAAELREAGAVEVHEGPWELLANLADSALGALAAEATAARSGEGFGEESGEGSNQGSGEDQGPAA